MISVMSRRMGGAVMRTMDMCRPRICTRGRQRQQRQARTTQGPTYRLVWLLFRTACQLWQTPTRRVGIQCVALVRRRSFPYLPLRATSATAPALRTAAGFRLGVAACRHWNTSLDGHRRRMRRLQRWRHPSPPVGPQPPAKSTRDEPPRKGQVPLRRSRQGRLSSKLNLLAWKLEGPADVAPQHLVSTEGHRRASTATSGGTPRETGAPPLRARHDTVVATSVYLIAHVVAIAGSLTRECSGVLEQYIGTVVRLSTVVTEGDGVGPAGAVVTMTASRVHEVAVPADAATGAARAEGVAIVAGVEVEAAAAGWARWW